MTNEKQIALLYTMLANELLSIIRKLTNPISPQGRVRILTRLISQLEEDKTAAMYEGELTSLTEEDCDAQPANED